VATWSNTASVPLRAREPPAPRRRAVPQRRRLSRGIVWIVLLAVLLTGVVALNVAVLRLNIGVDKLDQERTDLHAQNAALQSQLSSAQAAALIQAKAAHLGLVPAPAQDTTYVRLTRR
jgi:hypothetical protein